MGAGQGLLIHGALANPTCWRSGQSPDKSRVNQNRKLAELADNNRHILRCWHEWEFDGAQRRIILCLETALELRPGSDGFDARLLDELVGQATDMMQACASPIDSIRIVPER
jgi:hypothetical protein